MRTQTDLKELAAVIHELSEKHGSLRAAARALEIDPAYLCRLKSGAKVDPSDEVLRKLGMMRVVRFVRVPKIKIAKFPLARASR